MYKDMTSPMDFLKSGLKAQCFAQSCECLTPPDSARCNCGALADVSSLAGYPPVNHSGHTLNYVEFKGLI